MTTLKILLIAAVVFAFSPESLSAIERKSKLQVSKSLDLEKKFRVPRKVSAKKQRTASKPKLVAVAPVTIKNNQYTDVVADSAKSDSTPQGDVAVQMASSEYRTSFPTRRRSIITKNNISFEALGRGGLYSLNYDRLLNRSFALGLGFSYVSMQAGIGDLGTAEISIMTIPLYANFYINDSLRHRIVGTGGLTVFNLTVQGGSNLGSAASEAQEIPFELDLTAKASAVIPVPMAGFGYEYRSRGGFLGRVMGYGVYAGQFYPWAGLGVGGHF